LANVAVGERTQSSELIDEGAGQLIAAMKDLPPDPVLLTKLGFVFLRKGFASDATEFLAYALKLQPSEASAHANLGVAYKEQGEAEKAITELDQAIELDPALETAYRSLGEIYLSQQNFPELRRTLERYLKAMPNNLQAMKALDDLNSKFHSH
jgi:tetratricopeptide (TPR) repeat protein